MAMIPPVVNAIRIQIATTATLAPMIVVVRRKAVFMPRILETVVMMASSAMGQIFANQDNAPMPVIPAQR